MTAASSSLEARVLVCDPRNRITPQLSLLLYERFPQRGGDAVEITRVNQKDDISSAVKGHDAPYYSVVIYEASIANEQGIARVAETISGHDRFLPQMVFGEDMDVDQIGKCTRAGIAYFARSDTVGREELGKMFRRPEEIPGLTIVKVGGSAFDYNRQIDNGSVRLVCDILARIHGEPPATKHSPKKRMIVTAGTGQFGDVVKDALATRFAGASIQARIQYPLSMVQAMEANLGLLNSSFPLGSAALLDTSQFFHINRQETSRRIPLIATAPHYVMVRDGIPLQDSDTHTIALAEFYGAQRVILIKRTDGIYKFDPYRGFRLNMETRSCIDMKAWIKEQRTKNSVYPRVNITSLLHDVDISREGTSFDGKADGTRGHLMEDSALRYMAEKCHYVQEIVIVHVAPEELYYGKYGNIFKHVVTGRELQVTPESGGWGRILESNLRDAFEGKTNSKIVR